MSVSVESSPAFSNGNRVARIDTDESGAKVGSQIFVALFITIVLWNKVKIVTTKNNCALHFGAHHDTGENTATNGHVRCEWTFFVNVFSLDGFTWRLESKTNLLVPAVVGAFHCNLLGEVAFAIQENALLLLECFFNLRNG